MKTQYASMGLGKVFMCSICMIALTSSNISAGVRHQGLQDRNEAVQRAIDLSLEKLNAGVDLGNLAEISPFSEIDGTAKVHQLILYVLDATRETRWVAPIALSERMGLTKNDVFEAGRPLLDSGGPEVVKVVDDWALNYIEGVKRLQDTPDYSLYRSYLTTHKEDESSSLVKRMFMKSPGTAFSVMCDVYVDDATERNHFKAVMQQIGVSSIVRVPNPLGGKRIVSPEVEEAMQGLARSPLWWARLYVVEVMRRTFKYSNDPLLQHLKIDVNEIVRERAAAIMERGHLPATP
jgi:hypothetical protein